MNIVTHISKNTITIRYHIGHTLTLGVILVENYYIK
jgi:hypothetical protein